jgi:hypothetical protein
MADLRRQSLWGFSTKFGGNVVFRAEYDSNDRRDWWIKSARGPCRDVEKYQEDLTFAGTNAA